MMGRRRSFAGLLRVAKASGAATVKGDFSYHFLYHRRLMGRRVAVEC